MTWLARLRMEYGRSCINHNRRFCLLDNLDFGPDLVTQFLKAILGHLLLRPADPKTFLGVRLGDHVEVNVVDLLMRQTAIVLQDVVVLRARSSSKLLGHRLRTTFMSVSEPSSRRNERSVTYENLVERVVGDVGQFGAVVFRYDQLGLVSDTSILRGTGYPTA